MCTRVTLNVNLLLGFWCLAACLACPSCPHYLRRGFQQCRKAATEVPPPVNRDLGSETNFTKPLFPLLSNGTLKPFTHRLDRMDTSSSTGQAFSNNMVGGKPHLLKPNISAPRKKGWMEPGFQSLLTNFLSPYPFPQASHPWREVEPLFCLWVPRSLP